jgi:hypothetical protein
MNGTTLVFGEPWRSIITGAFERALTAAKNGIVRRIEFSNGSAAKLTGSQWRVIVFEDFEKEDGDFVAEIVVRRSQSA